MCKRSLGIHLGLGYTVCLMCCAGMLYHVELIVLHSSLQIRRLQIPKRVDWVAIQGLEATEAMKAVTRTIWRYTVMIRYQTPNMCQQTIPHFITLLGPVFPTDTQQGCFWYFKQHLLLVETYILFLPIPHKKNSAFSDDILIISVKLNMTCLVICSPTVTSFCVGHAEMLFCSARLC